MLIKLEDLENDKSIIVSKGKQLPQEYRDNGQIKVIGAGQKSPYLSSHANFEGQTITISSSGAYAGYVWFHDYPLWASDCTVIQVKNKVDINYLYLFLKSKQELIYSFQSGAGQPHVYWKNIKNIEIPLPSLTKQKEIAQMLDKASELIELRKATIEKLDELAQSIFIDMFGDPVSNPKKWDIKEIRDLILEAKYGTSEKSSEEIKKYAVLRMNNLTYSGCLDLTSLKYMDLEEKDKEKYLVKKGDLLFNRTNSKELVGKTAVYNREEPMAFAGYLIRVRCEDLATNVYISAFLNSKVGKKLLTNMCKSIVGMANINAQELQNIKIAHPPLELQQEFAKTIEKIESQKSFYEAELTGLQATFDALLSQSFEG